MKTLNFLFSIFLLIFLIPSVFLSPFTLALIKNDESSFINPAVKDSGLSETTYYKNGVKKMNTEEELLLMKRKNKLLYQDVWMLN